MPGTHRTNKQKISYLNAGNKYLDARKYAEAVIEFRNAVQIDPRFSIAHRQLGKAYLGLGNPEAAFREFTTTITLDPADAQSRLSLASLQLRRRQYSEAKSNVQKVLVVEPKNAEAHAVLGQQYLAMRDLPKAIAEYEEVTELEPGGTGGYAALGAMYMAAGRSSDAEAMYKRASAANPKSVDAHVAFGEFYFSQRKLSQAESEMQAACALDPAAVPPRIFLGRILVAEGRLADAERTYAGLKSIAPGDPHAYQALGILYSTTGQKEKALAEFRELAAAKPKDMAVTAWLIETLIDLYRIDQAKPLLQAAFAGGQNEKSKSAGDPRILLSYGRVQLAERKPSEAVESFQKVVKAEPNSANGYYYLGLAQKAAGLPVLAKGSFSRALELSPEMSSAAAALANLEVRSGNREEALQTGGPRG